MPTQLPHPLDPISTVVKPITIGIVVGEASGDALGADFMRQMNNLRDDIRWVGVGGSQMQAQGLNSLLDINRLAVMGLTEVVKYLPDLFKARDEILTAFTAEKIDMFIGIDAPDFNLRLGKVLKPQGVFCVQYVSPSIWAWREGRIEKIKKSTHLVLCLFPFELPVYQKHHHPAICVGHPLLHTIDKRLWLTPMHELRRELIWANPILYEFFSKMPAQVSYLIAVLPGSRRSEIAAILPNMLTAIQKLLVVDENLCFFVPTINQNHRAIVNGYLQETPISVQQRVVVSCDEAQANFSQQVMASADLILLASGTATLEAMLLSRPMVVIYQLKPVSYWLAKKLVKIPYVALPNILAGRQIVPELIQENANPTNICRVVQQNLVSLAYDRQVEDLQTTSDELRQQSNTMPANAVVDAWLKWLGRNCEPINES